MVLKVVNSYKLIIIMILYAFHCILVGSRKNVKSHVKINYWQPKFFFQVCDWLWLLRSTASENCFGI